MSKQLDRFELVEQIDKGGFTTVYCAIEHMGQGITRPAAVKVISSVKLDDEEQLEFLRREVEVLIELGGAPNIVAILGMGIDPEMGAWIAMELTGKSLVHSISDGPAEPDHARVLLRDTLRALTCVHGAGAQVLHRDLKPQNILNSQGAWKVADFGLAKRHNEDETMALATVKYAAPELLDTSLGEESARLDLYALGMVVYEFALGHELFRKQFPSIYDPAGGSKETGRDDRPKWMYWHTSQQMVLQPLAEIVEGYPKDLSDLIAAMTTKPVEQRIATAEEALRRLGEVGSVAPRQELDDDSEGRSSRTVSPIIAITAAAAVLVAMIGGLMWYLLEGRPNIGLDHEGLFQGSADMIRVTGSVENYPEAGRAEIRLRRGSVRTFPVALEANGKFTCNVRVRELGTFPAQMVVEDRLGVRVARASLELMRVEPTTVQIELKTSPIVPGARVLLLGGDGTGTGTTLTTDSNGTISTEVPFGEFALEVFHPRFRPLPMVTLQTGIDPVWTRTVNLVALDFAALRAEMQREINRLMRLMERKTTCPPGPLTAAEEEQVAASMVRLEQLADGDDDIELFLESIGRVEDCDQSTMVSAPELPPLPPDAVGDGGEGPDPAVRINRVIARIERLIDRKVNCPPGPLSEFEEQTLDNALDELETLALGDIDIELYADGARRVQECDPSSRPATVPKHETRAELQAAEEAAQAEALSNAAASDGTNPAGGPGGSREGTVTDPAADITSQVNRFLGQSGLGNLGRSQESGDEVEDTVGGAIARALAKVPPNPELVNKLTAMPLDEFADFVRSNVPTGAIEVEVLDEVNLVRVHGPLFRIKELELMTIRLAYGMGRIQPEVRIDPWDVCRRLFRDLTAMDADGVQVDAYVVENDPTMFVQFRKSEEFDPATANALAATFVIDQGLLWVRGYADRPATRPDRDEGELE